MGDYKSSQHEASVAEVMYHEQLNSYAWLWHKLTGIWPTHLLINNLRFGTITIAPCKPEIANAVMERRFAVDDVSKNPANYIKKDPFGWNSPCLDIDHGTMRGYCPHIFKCHPGQAEALGLQPPGTLAVLKELGDGFGDVTSTPKVESDGNTVAGLKDGF
jgi:hypothetical protein